MGFNKVSCDQFLNLLSNITDANKWVVSKIYNYDKVALSVKNRKDKEERKKKTRFIQRWLIEDWWIWVDDPRDKGKNSYKYTRILDVINLVIENGLIMLYFPSHCFCRLQHLDGHLRSKYLDDEVKQWLWIKFNQNGNFI